MPCPQGFLRREPGDEAEDEEKESIVLCIYRAVQSGRG